MEIERDGAAVAASSVEFGGCVQIGYFGAVGWCVFWLETGAVEWFEFEIHVFKVFEGAGLMVCLC